MAMATLPRWAWMSGVRRSASVFSWAAARLGAPSKTTARNARVNMGEATGSLLPPMRIPDRAHRREDAVPRLRFHHDFVGEHAAVPADVFDLAGHVAVAVAQPKPGM